MFIAFQVGEMIVCVPCPPWFLLLQHVRLGALNFRNVWLSLTVILAFLSIVKI